MVRRFRFHRGSLVDSLATTQNACSVADIDRIIAPATVALIRPYGFDARCGWDVHLVVDADGGVAGMTDGPE